MMDRSPNRPPRRLLHDRLITCLWWLVCMGGIAAGTAVGLVLALWLALPPLSGLLLLAAGWLGGNAAGWRLAARLDEAAARRTKEEGERIRAGLRGTGEELAATSVRRPGRNHRSVRRAGVRPLSAAACR